MIRKWEGWGWGGFCVTEESQVARGLAKYQISAWMLAGPDIELSQDPQRGRTG